MKPPPFDTCAPQHARGLELCSSAACRHQHAYASSRMHPTGACMRACPTPNTLNPTRYTATPNPRLPCAADARCGGAVVLDMMEPWTCIEAAQAALKGDRSVVCVCPNVTQVCRLVEEIKARRLPLCLWRTVEVAHRSWDIRPPAAHPSFKQVWSTPARTRPTSELGSLCGRSPGACHQAAAASLP